MKKLLLLFIIIHSLYSCQTKKNEFENTTLVSVEKKDNTYLVNDRCDGGYPVLRFSKNEFYFYVPQEGSYYHIRDFTTNKGNYTFVTDKYKNLKQDSFTERNIKWKLIKMENNFWEFSNNINVAKYKVIDSLLLQKSKILIVHQPCTDCFDKELCDEWNKKTIKTKEPDKSKNLYCLFNESNYEIEVKYNNQIYKYENLEFTGFRYSKIFSKENSIFCEFKQDSGGRIICEYNFNAKDKQLYLNKITYKVFDKNEQGSKNQIFTKKVNKKIQDIDGDELLQNIQKNN
ncbi:hypothetical protein [Epilithonimonas hungarica]|uniref:Lipoprotein n=1 Tax=Epilithonimonas hungarica TaxID=454006 RepID=A0A1G7VXJ6_9FLAO|nr:hypothetical protein [Epilithonimonas hungarica]SDG64482.1 hypothetical protein SAMN05421825_3748 [Epilithonimonas hungarica]